MSLITLKNLSFKHPHAKTFLWKDLNLDVKTGDRVLITGPSGAGKSTLLLAMAGFIQKFSPGTLQGTLKLSYQQAGLVLQNPETQRITPTVFEEVSFALENRGLPENFIQKRVNETLALFNLSLLSNRYTMTLSGGECQRLSLACAFAQDPEIFFLDEPTAYLDPWAKQSFFKNLSDLISDKTFVLIKHLCSNTQIPINKAVQLTPSGLIALNPKTLFKSQPFQENLENVHHAQNLVGIQTLEEHTVPPKEKCSIQLKNVTHTYPNAAPLFQPVNAKFSPGTISAIVGPSGSGKTTLLKKIIGLLPPSPGTLFYGKKDATEMKKQEWYRLILYLPQNPEHFFLRMTVREEWQLSALKTSSIAAVAKLFHLDPMSHVNILSLSEGEKRRLTLALAFLDPRPVILMDEPTYGLDQTAFTTLIFALKALKAQGKTVIIVTHALELVEICADDVWLLSEGTCSLQKNKNRFQQEVSTLYRASFETVETAS